MNALECNMYMVFNGAVIWSFVLGAYKASLSAGIAWFAWWVVGVGAICHSLGLYHPLLCVCVCCTHVIYLHDTVQFTPLASRRMDRDMVYPRASYSFWSVLLIQWQSLADVGTQVIIRPSRNIAVSPVIPVEWKYRQTERTEGGVLTTKNHT